MTDHIHVIKEDGEFMAFDCGNKECDDPVGVYYAAGVTLAAPAEGLRIVPDGTREFVAFAVEYLRSVIPDHATVQAGDRLLAALAQSAAPAKERCLCGGPWPCPDIDAPNYRPEAYVPHGLAQPAAPAEGLDVGAMQAALVAVIESNALDSDDLLWLDKMCRKAIGTDWPYLAAPAEGLDR